MSYGDFLTTKEQRKLALKIKYMDEVVVRKALIYMVGYQNMIPNIEEVISDAATNVEEL